MAKDVKFGPVTITGITETNNGGPNRWVQLEQSTETTYSGQSANTPRNLGLWAQMVESKPLVYTGKRTCRQLLPADVAEQLVIGQEIPGHIVHEKFSTPQWDGHESQPDGLYYTSFYSAEFQEDKTTTATPAKVNQEAPAVNAFKEAQLVG